jgi:hypothetical protein
MNTLHRAALDAALGAALLLGATSGHAALAGYTSKASFDAAIGALSGVQTVDFDTVASGTTFASGSGTGGLSFTYAISGYTMQVSSTFGTTSGSNYLGLDNPDTAFYLGDSFTIDFGRTVNAVGLYLITGSDTLAGDLELAAGSGAVQNTDAPDVQVSDGQAFYLGLVESDPGLGFTTATVRGVVTPGAFLAFTVDDITSAAVSAVPEPATWGLMLVGLAGLAARARRRTG